MRPVTPRAATLPPPFVEALRRRQQAGTFKAPRPEPRKTPPRPATQAAPALYVPASAECFPTPRPLAERMAVLALVARNNAPRILEPSAGTGALVAAILKHAPTAVVQAVESNHTLAEHLRRTTTAEVLEEDFLKLPPPLERFDAVIMNPPFSRGQDAEHIRHAATYLHMGGRLVAIASAAVTFSTRAPYPAFRAWLEEKAATVEPLPPDTFKAAGTSVNTVLIVIDN